MRRPKHNTVGGSATRCGRQPNVETRYHSEAKMDIGMIYCAERLAAGMPRAQGVGLGRQSLGPAWWRYRGCACVYNVGLHMLMMTTVFSVGQGLAWSCSERRSARSMYWQLTMRCTSLVGIAGAPGNDANGDGAVAVVEGGESRLGIVVAVAVGADVDRVAPAK